MLIFLELNGNPDYQAWVDSGGTLPFPGGESREGFQERCREGFVRILREAQAEKRRQIAVVAHGGTLMSVLSAFAVPEKPFYDWQVKNGCGYVASTDYENGTIVLRNLKYIEL